MISVPHMRIYNTPILSMIHSWREALFCTMCIPSFVLRYVEMCKHEGGSSSKDNSGCKTNTNPQVPVIRVPVIQIPTCRDQWALSSDTHTMGCSKTPLGHLALLVILTVQLVEFRHCSEDLHSCSVFPSILFHSIDNDHRSSGGWNPEVGEYFHRQVMQVNWNEWNKILWTYSIHNVHEYK